YALRHFLASYLALLRDTVQILGTPGLTLAGDASSLGPEDLLVAVAFRPYTRAVVKLVEVVREAGVPVLAITDTGSPIDSERHGGLTLAIEQPFYFDSTLAPLRSEERRVGKAGGA